MTVEINGITIGTEAEITETLANEMAVKVNNVLQRYMLAKAESLVKIIYTKYAMQLLTMSEEEIYQFILDLEKNKD